MTTAFARALAVALCVFSAVGCQTERDAAEWIGRAHAAHREADRRLARGDLQGAREALEIAALTAAPTGASGKVTRVVRKDLMYRLAVLELEADHADRALDWASRGLALGEERDVFTTNLRIARGRAHEALGRPKEAARDYHEALLISEALLERALGEDG